MVSDAQPRLGPHAKRSLRNIQVARDFWPPGARKLAAPPNPKPAQTGSSSRIVTPLGRRIRVYSSESSQGGSGMAPCTSAPLADMYVDFECLQAGI